MTPKQLEESTAYLKAKGFENPEIGIVLGTGLGKLADQIDNWQDGLSDQGSLPKRLSKAQWAIEIAQEDSNAPIVRLRERLEAMIAEYC